MGKGRFFLAALGSTAGALPAGAATGAGFCPDGDDHDNITNFSGGKLEDKFK